MPSPKRSLSVVAILVAATIFASQAPVSAVQFPPQMPSPAELARMQEQANASFGQMSAAQRELNSLVANFEAAQTRLQNLNAEISAAEAQHAAFESQLQAVQSAINSRAASNYRFGPTVLLNVLLGARTFRQMTTAMDMFESVSAHDSHSLRTVQQLKDDTARLKAELDGKVIDQHTAVEQLQQRQRQMQESLVALGQQYETVKARLDSSKAGFAFPVRAPYSFVDTFLAPRAGYRRHQGIDIFALKGTPVYAVVNGVIEDKGVNPLGGNKLWLRSPTDGWRYYYAHLNNFAPGINNGTRVNKGQVIGYVGNTGNAITTPPHLHFETHAPGASAINPHPILKRVNLIK